MSLVGRSNGVRARISQAILVISVRHPTIRRIGEGERRSGIAAATSSIELLRSKSLDGRERQNVSEPSFSG